MIFSPNEWKPTWTLARGPCHLAQPPVAGMVAGALQFFEGQRYLQFAWSVMPNHVHTVFRPFPSWPLVKILHSWKSFTSKEANKLLVA